MPLLSKFTSALSEMRSSLFGSPSTPLTALAAWNDFGGGPTSSGEIVTERTAMSISTVYTCVTILSDAVASLSCQLMKHVGQGTQQANEHDLYNLLASSPNPEMTAFTFWSSIVGSSALCGNGYAQILRNSLGRPESIWPLHPMKTEPIRLPDGSLAFRTSDGMASGTRILRSEDVLHFPLFSLDGIKGIGPITAARETFGTAKAMEKYGARYFANGATSPVVYIHKGDMPDDKAQSAFISSWRAAHAGENQHKDGFLFGDWDVKTIGLSPEDSQFLVSRNYTRADIAAMFKVPPHMVGSLEKLASANYGQQQLAFVTDCLRPILVRIEQELNRKLLPTSGPNAGKLFVTFDLSERLRGDFASQMQAFATARQWGWMSANDIRLALRMNPIGSQGDIYLTPINMADSERPGVSLPTVTETKENNNEH